MLHTILLTAAPYVQSAAGIHGAWTDSIPLLMLFLLVPMTAVALLHYGQHRLGGVILLSFMAATAYFNAMFLWSAFSLPATHTPNPSLLPWYQLFLAVLFLLGFVGTVVAMALLQEVHRASPAPPVENTR